MALIQFSLAGCDKPVESSSAEFKIGDKVYCCEPHFLQDEKKTFKMWSMRTSLFMERHWTMAINAQSTKTGSNMSYINKTLNMSSLTIVETLAMFTQVQFYWH